MAKLTNNVIMRGASGSIGKLVVFKQVNNETHVTKHRKKSDHVPSEAEAQTRTNFQEAVLYAKTALKNPEVKAGYEAARTPGLSSSNVAVADFMNAPDIHEIDISQYTGKPGSTITARVSDDFKVDSVRVKIQNPDGTLVEEGDATLVNNDLWVFVATVLNESLEHDKITVSARDLPGSELVGEQIL